ncbi:MAG: hypothetical protein INH41_12175 [Myxococcaceae bacterium]|jgi:hypothetical protein|nr:hypothetical protein [Myxococcaceae bacterium]MCA3013142.1 hypothetical protein [Myxococcaceae bacterium]
MQRLRHLLRLGALLHLVVGPALVLWLLASSPWVIGEGRVEGLLQRLEAVDWRWWLIGAVALVWALPVVAVAGLLQARRAGLEATQLRARVEHLLEHQQLPLAVDVDTRIAVQVEAPLSIPIDLSTTLTLDEQVQIETSVPFKVELPLDTVVETSVFGLGTLKVPIRARIPIDLVVPIKGAIRIKTDALPVHIHDRCVAQLPVFEVPIRSRIETKLALLDNLKTAREQLRKGVGEALKALEKPPGVG